MVKNCEIISLNVAPELCNLYVALSTGRAKLTPAIFYPTPTSVPILLINISLSLCLRKLMSACLRDWLKVTHAMSCEMAFEARFIPLKSPQC